MTIILQYCCFYDDNFTTLLFFMTIILQHCCFLWRQFYNIVVFYNDNFKTLFFYETIILRSLLYIRNFTFVSKLNNWRFVRFYFLIMEFENCIDCYYKAQ